MRLSPVEDETGIPWLMWLPRDSQNSVPVKFDGIRIVVFHYFDQHLNELNKWIEIIDKIADEYAGRIRFAAQDISTIQNFFKTLSREDFGSYRANTAPRIYGLDNDGCKYTMHMFFSYKYIKDFCEKLLLGKMFQAVVVNPIQELDLPASNFNQLKKETEKDLFVMFYDPACYYWTIQLRRLRKLARLLINEDVVVVIINRGHNYLDLSVDKTTELNNLHGVTALISKGQNEWITNSHGSEFRTREYLRHISQQIDPELKEYDRRGDPRLPEHALSDIRYLYESKITIL